MSHRIQLTHTVGQRFTPLSFSEDFCRHQHRIVHVICELITVDFFLPFCSSSSFFRLIFGFSFPQIMSTMTLSAADSDICQQFSNSFSPANTTDNLSINSNALQIHMSDLNTFVNTPSPSSVASGGSTRGRSPERCTKNLCSTLKGKQCCYENQGKTNRLFLF